MDDTEAGLLSPGPVNQKSPAAFVVASTPAILGVFGEYQLGALLIRSIPPEGCSPRDLHIK